MLLCIFLAACPRLLCCLTLHVAQPPREVTDESHGLTHRRAGANVAWKQAKEGLIVVSLEGYWYIRSHSRRLCSLLAAAAVAA